MSTALVPKAPDQPVPISIDTTINELAVLRSTEVNMRWEGGKLGILLNTSGLVGVAWRFTAGPSRLELALIVIGSIFAFLLNQYLYWSIRRSGQHLRLWVHIRQEIERNVGIAGGVKIFTSDRYLKLQNARFTINDVLLWVMTLFMIMWALTGAMALGAAIIGVKP